MILEKVYRKSILPMLEKTPMSIAMRIPLINTAIYSTILSRLMEQFGGCVEIFIVGGAAINKETEDFLRKIKFPLTVGYGMTECAPLISFEIPYLFKPGSCGKIVPGMLEAKINSSDPQNIPGELLIKGEHVMMGYYKNETATKAVLEEDGWLHTGDMCTIGPDGDLYIRGRCKTMILSGSGQNIYPEEIEERLNNLYMVAESLVIENNGKLTALVVPDYDLANAEHIDMERLPEIMEENLKTLNTLVASYEKVANKFEGIAKYETINVTVTVNEVLAEQNPLAHVFVDGKEYDLNFLKSPVEFFMNKDHKISIHWTEDMVETFRFVATK
jgi:long-chain acyl-CoA synthetase